MVPQKYGASPGCWDPGFGDPGSPGLLDPSVQNNWIPGIWDLGTTGLRDSGHGIARPSKRARGAELRGGSSRIVGRGCEANLGGADLVEVSGGRAKPNCQAPISKRTSKGFHFPCGNCKDSLAEWSKALAQGASPQGRGFEPHSFQ